MEKINMKKKLAAGMAVLSLCLSIGATLAHDHDHAAAAPAKLELNHGKKWPTDATLRQGMSRIGDAVRADAPAEKLAGQVNAQIAYLVQNCKLDQETDAMLHLVLADLIAGAELLQQGKPTEGMGRLNQALTAYGAYFEHPGWQPAR